MSKDNIYIRREVEVCVTPQAQKILDQTKFTCEDFIDWSLHKNKISFGGHNVVVFLEAMYEDN